MGKLGTGTRKFPNTQIKSAFQLHFGYQIPIVFCFFETHGDFQTQEKELLWFCTFAGGNEFLVEEKSGEICKKRQK